MDYETPKEIIRNHEPPIEHTHEVVDFEEVDKFGFSNQQLLRVEFKDEDCMFGPRLIKELAEAGFGISGIFWFESENPMICIRETGEDGVIQK